VINDGLVDSPVDQVVITVRQVNKAPVANAGSDQSVNEGATVSLDGSASSDPDGDALTYKWSVPEGITLNSTTVQKPTFTAPEVTNNTGYTLTLVVNDGLVDSPAKQVVITVKNVDHAPYVKNAIKNISVDKGSPDQNIDLKTVFADDDLGDVLVYSAISNSNNLVVEPKINGSTLTLDFSSVNNGLSEIVVAANSNGKEVNTKFTVEVNIPSWSDPMTDDKADIQIYPNPAKGSLQINLKNAPKSGCLITLYNSSGKVLLKKTFFSNEVNLDLEKYVPGLYFIRIEEQPSKIFKIILL